MQEIERFTKQRIPAVVVPGFEAEPGEKGEPIAMGRQTIWGGAGKPPSREVMLAAAKAARQEMMQRIRDNKAADSERGGRNGAAQAAARPAQREWQCQRQWQWQWSAQRQRRPQRGQPTEAGRLAPAAKPSGHRLPRAAPWRRRAAARRRAQ